ncbi:MAG: hypothetical protein NTX53_21310 [candidate division WOR-3 bacterium]|nr:hypothetical protein [candidate division WOR-3 bacterium]
MSSLARRIRSARVCAGLACVAALLLTSACHVPRETRSVHLPLAVGNQWVYDVKTESTQGTAVIEVVSRNKGAYGLLVSGDFGHLAEPDSLLHLRCRDTVLWLLNAVEVNGRTWWSSILSDDPDGSCTQTLLLFRQHSGSKFASQPIGTVVAGGDTFSDCLRLSCLRVHEDYAFFGGGGDTSWVTEDYAPGVGIVRLVMERHWWSLMWFPMSFSDSGTWVDRWELRDYSLSD